MPAGTFIWAVPVLLAVYFHFRDELRSNNVPWREIVDGDDVIAVFENQHKLFILEHQEISISENSTLSNEDLNVLLLKWGVNPDGMDENDTKAKIHLLLKVSSPDFWSKNYALHPKKNRISTYLWVHRIYFKELAALKEIKDRDELKIKFVDFLHNLSEHAEYEEVALFKFLKEKVDLDSFLDGLLDKLSREHIFEQKNTAKEIMEHFDTTSVDDLIVQITRFEQDLIEHLTEEDQYMMPLMLNIDNALYRQYSICPYLVWKYYLMYYKMWRSGWI
eukprot:626538_1